MRVRLMDPDADFSAEAAEPPEADDLRRDLELDFLWNAMGSGDAFLTKVARAATLQTLTDPATIRYRQAAFDDVLAERSAVNELYALTLDALDAKRSVLTFGMRGRPELNLSHAVRLLTVLVDRLESLREICARVEGSFRSEAFTAFFATVEGELTIAYLAELRARVKDLGLRRGLLFSAGVGDHGNVVGPVPRREKAENRRLFHRAALKRPVFSFTIPERDESGFHALSDLRDAAVRDVSETATLASEHVLGFFGQLRTELAFYRGEVNLYDIVGRQGVPACTPETGGATRLAAVDLRDPCLALRSGSAPVANDVTLADSEGSLLVITGANHGGKSTFLRALGVAQVMMQAGMFVVASAYSSPIAGRVFTHWTREEDADLKHGKFDDELERMSRIVESVARRDLVLCNESFASTNEAEGSEIAWEVVSALVRSGVRVMYVTHMYDFAERVAAGDLAVTFLRAPRDDTGTRSYRLEEGAPLPTSFGVELYEKVFGVTL